MHSLTDLSHLTPVPDYGMSRLEIYRSIVLACLSAHFPPLQEDDWLAGAPHHALVLALAHRGADDVQDHTIDSVEHLPDAHDLVTEAQIA